MLSMIICRALPVHAYDSLNSLVLPDAKKYAEDLEALLLNCFNK